MFVNSGLASEEILQRYTTYCALTGKRIFQKYETDLKLVPDDLITRIQTTLARTTGLRFNVDLGFYIFVKI